MYLDPTGLLSLRAYASRQHLRCSLVCSDPSVPCLPNGRQHFDRLIDLECASAASAIEASWVINRCCQHNQSIWRECFVGKRLWYSATSAQVAMGESRFSLASVEALAGCQKPLPCRMPLPHVTVQQMHAPKALGNRSFSSKCTVQRCSKLDELAANAFAYFCFSKMPQVRGPRTGNNRCLRSTLFSGKTLSTQNQILFWWTLYQHLTFGPRWKTYGKLLRLSMIVNIYRTLMLNPPNSGARLNFPLMLWCGPIWVINLWTYLKLQGFSLLLLMLPETNLEQSSTATVKILISTQLTSSTQGAKFGSLYRLPTTWL